MPAWNPRANEVFLAALEIEDQGQRESYLDAACGGDADLRRQVQALLTAHNNVGDFLENPVPAGTIDQPVREPAISPPGPSDPSSQTPTEGRGTRIGPYKLLQQIGEGGMGSVWMAEQHEPIHRIVALKIIKADLGSSQVIARFEAERQALALMDHPNIARVFDGGTTGGKDEGERMKDDRGRARSDSSFIPHPSSLQTGRPYFVMELVKGTPITKYCDQHRLTIAQRLELFVQVCQALQHAHQKGIIHRDIKPSNVLVAPYDGRPVVKVIDFGVAKATGQKLTDKTMFTEVGAVVGTMQYMSPEQAELNNQDIDTRSDIYSLGVLLYELLTGTTPLDVKRLRGAMMAAMLMAIQEEEPPKPSTRLSESKESLPSISAQRQMEPAKLTRSMRGDLDWIVMKALAKERNRRYETANGFAADVERFLHDEPVSAGPPTVGYKLRKFVHRNRGQVAAAAALLFALLAGTTVSTWQAVRAMRAEEVARGEQSKTAEALIVADEQRMKAETQAASLAVDIDLKYCEGTELPLGLLRLANTLKTIPEHAKELRECVALNILAWGQQICPAISVLEHDGFPVEKALLSPDGLTVLTAGPDGKACLWDSLTGKQRAVMEGVWTRRFGAPGYIGDWDDQVRFSSDGRTVLTVRSRIAGEKGAAEIRADQRVSLWDVETGLLRTETAATSPASLSGSNSSRNNDASGDHNRDSTTPHK